MGHTVRFAEMSGSDDELEDERSARLLRLRGVYAGPTTSNGGFRLISVECYDDGIVVRWASQCVPSAEPLLGEDQLELSDDAGTQYVFHDGGSSISEGPAVVHASGQVTFCPTVPPAAHRLWVEAGAEPFEFDISDLARRSPI